MCKWKEVGRYKEQPCKTLIDFRTDGVLCDQFFQLYDGEIWKFIYCPNCGEKIEFEKEYK